MVFPQTELPLFVDIAPGASPAGTVDSWNSFWVDITRDVRVANNVVIEEGVPDEANQADPGSCGLTINNGISKVPATAGQVGCYSTRNPIGPYYGALVKNTPLRVRIQRGRDTFARTVSPGWGTSDSGFTWSATTSVYSTDGTRGIATIPSNSNSATTAIGAGSWDFELTAGVMVDITTATADFGALVKFRRSSSTNEYTFYMDWTPAGTLALFIQRVIGGVTTNIANANLGAVTGGTQFRIRLRAEGGFIAAKMWPASGSEPASWTLQVSGQGSWTLDNTSLGTNIQLQHLRFSGSTTTTAYWSDLKINQYPFIGTVPEWPVRWDQSGNDCTAPVKAAGILRRLQQGKSPVKSPLYSFIDGMGASALWTLEDDSGATLAASQTPGVAGATFYTTSPGGWNGLPKLGGTGSQYNVDVDTTISGTLPRITPNGSWFAWFAFYMPVLPVPNPTIFRVRSSGSAVQWDMRISSTSGGSMNLLGQAADGTVLVNVSTTYVAGQWTVGQIEIQQTGTTFTGRIVRYGITDGSFTGATSSAVTGNIGAPNAWSIYGQVGFQQGAAGPVAFWNSIPTVSIPNLFLAANGFAGEDAGTRISRLATERNVRLDLISGGATSLMGVQTADQFLNVLGEAATTDLGLLTEFRGGLRYRTRGRRYNQAARMALDFAAGHIKSPPEPTDDDQRLRNDVTVTRKNGSSARAYDSANIALSGTYDTEVDINPMTDNDLPGQARFRLFLGTWSEMRWPSITLDLAHNAAVSNYIERATALDPGAYVTLANPPTNLPVSTVHLLVEGIQQTLGPYEWTMTLVCQPYTPWRITDSSNTVLIPRMDLVGSTLGVARSATAVGATDSWTITNSGRFWDTTQTPYDWMVNGERVTVTAISGTTSQTATVTRGVNGITKTHAIGEPIVLADPLNLAL